MVIMNLDWVKTKKGMVGGVALGAMVLVVGGIVLSAKLDTSFSSQNIVLSDDFKVARYNAGLKSREVAELSEVVRVKINEANIAEQEKNTARAEELLNEAQIANNEAAKTVADLSRNLQVLIDAINKMPVGVSQRYAYAAMTAEISLVSEYIVYTKNVASLIEAIAAGIEIGKHDRTAVATALQRANENVRRINTLNKEFQEKMGNFDTSVQ